MEVLGYTSLALLLAKYFEPLDPARNWIVNKWINFTVRRKWFRLATLAKVVTCPFCMGLWGTLLLTHDLFLSTTVSILAMVIDLIIINLRKNNEDN